MRKLDERQQKPTMHTEITDEKHVCVNCGTAFVGRFCPQCGLRANRHRMTAKNLVQGFLDIWGMGSQPMLRSIHELFWRPGYMMAQCIRQWYTDGKIPKHQTFGLEEGYTEVILNKVRKIYIWEPPGYDGDTIPCLTPEMKQEMHKEAVRKENERR